MNASALFVDEFGRPVTVGVLLVTMRLVMA